MENKIHVPNHQQDFSDYIYIHGVLWVIQLYPTMLQGCATTFPKRATNSGAAWACWDHVSPRDGLITGWPGMYPAFRRFI